MKDDGNFLAGLAFFRAVEHDPMDKAHERLVSALVDEFGHEALTAGLALVAAILRQELRRHAAKTGCDCGSEDWLARMVYAHNAKP